jgi:hypothetical protein
MPEQNITQHEECTMKRLILALTFAAAIAVFTSGPAFAECLTTTYSYAGKTVTCYSCCYGSHCHANCY